MAYAQKNYLQVLGINGVYTIAQAGCFLDAFSNLTGVDPITLNAYFRDHGIYVDVDDGVRDDLGWNSIERYDANWKVVSVGTGWPRRNDAIVKFYYRSPNSGQMTTHFCKVADWQNQLILDSWDGIVKKPGVYGQPVAFAEYQHYEPQPVQPVPQATPSPTGDQWVHLPPAAGTWAAYNVGSQLRKGTDDQKDANGNFMTLRPDKYDLRYRVIQWINGNAVVIDTQSYGRVAIWVKGTIAEFYTKQPEVTAAPVAVPTVEAVVEPVAATPVTPEPAAPPAPVEAVSPKVEQLDYELEDWKDGVVLVKRTIVAEVDGNALDLEGLRDSIEFKAGSPLPFYGEVLKDGLDWYLLKSKNGGQYYGVRPDDLKKEQPEHKNVFGEMRNLSRNLEGRKKLAAFLGTITGFAMKVIRTLMLKNKQEI